MIGLIRWEARRKEGRGTRERDRCAGWRAVGEKRKDVIQREIGDRNILKIFVHHRNQYKIWGDVSMAANRRRQLGGPSLDGRQW